MAGPIAALGAVGVVIVFDKFTDLPLWLLVQLATFVVVVIFAVGAYKEWDAADRAVQPPRPAMNTGVSGTAYGGGVGYQNAPGSTTFGFAGGPLDDIDREMLARFHRPPDEDPPPDQEPRP